MKVVSLVPSWTETLIECGVNVVGRTRFCIHPRSECQKIPALGGTKDLDLDRLKALNADLLILDQEENLPWMKENSPIPSLVTHVTDLHSLPQEIHRMAQALRGTSEPLMKVADRWRAVGTQPKSWSWNRIPGEIETLRRTRENYEKLVYVIWKKPWMGVSKETFIGSVLSHLGAENYFPDFDSKYPAFEIENFDPQKTYFLFSSEPFPFHQRKKELIEMGIEGSLVDGESFSWFGLRSLRFLESLSGCEGVAP